MKLLTCFVTLAAAAMSMPAAAQLTPMKMTGVYKQTLKGKGRVAIPSYGISFVVAQKASANASLTAQSRLEQRLVGLDEATMRRLADEAHADLKAQLAAANIAVASDAEAAGVLTAAAAPLRPGNMEDKKAGGGIPFGKKRLSKGYIAVGATAAPLTALFQAGGTPNAFAMLGAIGGVSKLYKPAEAIDALLIFPMLTIDFADTDVRVGTTLAGGRRASIDSEVAFIVRGESRVDTALPMSGGRFGTPGSFVLSKDYVSDVPFTLGATRASAMSSATNVGGGMTAYQDSTSGAGGVRVDLPRYVALVQEGYRAYNAAIVAALASTR